MRITDEFSLKLQQNASDASPCSQLLRRGRPTGREIDAAWLEAAIATPRGFLLFTTDDVPFEEFLGIHLLDIELNTIDGASIGAAYSTGMFSDLQITGPGRVRFGFIGETPWSVVLLDRPVLRTPLNAEPSGVHRRLGWSRHFTIERLPRADQAAIDISVPVA